MRRLVLVLLVMMGMAPAYGQVTINQRALEQLGGAPVQAAPRRQPVHRYIRRYYYRPLPLPPPYVPKPVPVIAVKPLPPPPKPVPPLALTMIFPGTANDIPPQAARKLKTLIDTLGIRADHFLIAATAPGIKGDPSVARRLSLNRALAVRAKLRAAGVPSEHIIVQALGAVPGQVDNRVTLTQTP